MSDNNTTPKKTAGLTLTCMVTGKSRTTTKQYLEEKAAKHNMTVAEIRSNYISKDALKLLRSGKTLTEVRSTLNVGSEVAEVDSATLTAAVLLNGKRAKEKSTSATAEVAVPENTPVA